MLSQKDGLKAKEELSDFFSRLEEKSIFYGAVGSITRLKIVFLLDQYKELCPSEIAAILEISKSAVSHQLRILEHARVIRKIRMGKMICYSLAMKNASKLWL